VKNKNGFALARTRSIQYRKRRQ